RQQPSHAFNRVLAFGYRKLFLVRKLSAPFVDAFVVVSQSRPFCKPTRQGALQFALKIHNEIVCSRAQVSQKRLWFMLPQRTCPVFAPATKSTPHDVIDVRMPPGDIRE